MPSVTETVNVTTTTNVAGVVKQGANQLVLVAPLDTGATVSANVVTEYTRSGDAVTDHGAGSALAVGVAAALAAGIRTVYAVGAAQSTGSPFTYTVGTATVVSTGTITAGNMPLTSVTSVAVDGVTKTALFTTGDPTGATVAAGNVLINPSTGAFKSGAATSGSGSGFVVVYKSHDWASVYAALDSVAYEYHTYAGAVYNEANFGVYKSLSDHATTARKLVAAALASAADPATQAVQDVITAIRSGRVKLLAAYYTGDLTSAFAATTARMPVNGTSKEQPAPLGITFTAGYVRSKFGSEETPVSGTFHYHGCNAVFQAPGGAFLISNDRAATALTDFERFHSTRRCIRVVENDMEDELLAARRSSSTAIPFSDVGILLVQGIIEKALTNEVRAGILLSYTVSIPQFASISNTDKLDRVLRGIDVSVLLQGQIHLFVINLGVGL